MSYRVHAAVTALLCLTALSGCGSSENETSPDNSTQGASASNAAASPAARPASPATIDANRIGPGDLWTGKSITDAFGVACPVQPNTNGRPDILGVALGGSLPDAVGGLACRYPEAQFTANNNENKNPYVALNGSTYGLKMLFKPQDGRPYETIDVFLSGAKNDEKVVGVWRVVYYRPEHAPLKDKIAADMAAKYGPFDGTVSLKSVDGQRLVPNVPPYSRCLRAINQGTLSYSDSFVLKEAVRAGCGDTVAFSISNNVGAGLAGDFTSFLFNPTYGAQQDEIANAEAQSMKAARDAETIRQADQRATPEL
ncbi:hypothetical protein [Sphingomonas colocasiae]|uniref:Secreted protein n=1 Tax=Sphingomonas colocasiae TaxID=1848973 RepID=A0ABS7PV36_9SPHN|nr:hypothetical protein [Sphingomonas colocasiae]MBY8823859.1 hypothetical protein [Sphingomonas colocasiae]